MIGRRCCFVVRDKITDREKMTPMTPRSGVAVVVVLAVVVSAVSAAGTQFEVIGLQ